MRDTYKFHPSRNNILQWRRPQAQNFDRKPPVLLAQEVLKERREMVSSVVRKCDNDCSTAISAKLKGFHKVTEPEQGLNEQPRLKRRRVDDANRDEGGRSRYR